MSGTRSTFEQLIATYETTPGRGLPIGNLTSQYFANHYLAVADHFLIEQLRVPCAVRYMDDVLILGTDMQYLLSVAESYRTFLDDTLHLCLHPMVANYCHFGIPFLGYTLFPNRVNLSLRSRRRFSYRIVDYQAAYDTGYISENDYHNRLTSLFSFTNYANSIPFRKKILSKSGILP